MTAALSLTATAQAVGLSASRFRHVWQALVADGRLPPPFLSGPGVRPKWDAQAIADLKSGQLGCRAAARPTQAPPSPQPQAPPAGADPHLNRQRNTLRGLLQRQGR